MTERMVGRRMGVTVVKPGQAPDGALSCRRRSVWCWSALSARLSCIAGAADRLALTTCVGDACAVAAWTGDTRESCRLRGRLCAAATKLVLLRDSGNQRASGGGFWAMVLRSGSARQLRDPSLPMVREDEESRRARKILRSVAVRRGGVIALGSAWCAASGTTRYGCSSPSAAAGPVRIVEPTLGADSSRLLFEAY